MAKGGAYSPQRNDIERMVREALAQLTSRAGQPSPQATAGGELVVSSSVVSLGDLEGRLNGISRVLAPRGAIFTPAARDELRRRNIAVASTVATPGTSANQHLVLGVAETKFEPASLVSMLSREKLTIKQLPRLGLIEVVDEICQHVVKGGKRGMLITGQVATAMCVANRQPGIRAALAYSLPAVTDAIATVAANLLIVDPAGKGPFELRQMTRVLIQGRPNVGSAILQARLS